MVLPTDSVLAERTRLAEVVSAVSGILGHGLRQSAPANVHSMRFRWPPKGLKLEARATAGSKSYAARYLDVLVSSFLQSLCERFDIRIGPYDGAVYRNELRANTDFRKYDGMLRAVLDVSERQAAEIENYLEREYRSGRIVYGVHRADAALMTCLVFSLDQSEHVHFIDGADGGYAKAAVGFKARLGSR